MRVEQIAFPIIREIGKRPRLADALFHFSRWGNPFSPERFSDPYSLLDKMLADGPVTYHRMYRQWFVFGYDEVHELLRSTKTGVAAPLDLMLSISPYTKLSEQAKASLSNWLLLTDPPDHTRLRNIVSRVFTPKRIEAYEPKVRAIAQELTWELARAAGDAGRHAGVDVVAGLTAPLPIYVIAELLGLPRDRWDWLRSTSDDIAGLLDPFLPFDPNVMNQHFAELHQYFSELARERRDDPKDDLISLLAQAEDGDVLSNDELVAMIGFLMFAGHQTTTGLLGNSFAALAAHPEQRALLVAHPELIGNAVEELIRFETSVLLTPRTATEDLELAGKKIPAGANIVIMYGAANRDPRRWPDAGHLRLDRVNPRPISFGHGIHHCLGAALARLELRVALPIFLEAFGEYAIEPSTIEWKQSGTLRGPIKLLVSPATVTT
jgi:cytochrome P450